MMSMFVDRATREKLNVTPEESERNCKGGREGASKEAQSCKAQPGENEENEKTDKMRD